MARLDSYSVTSFVGEQIRRLAAFVTTDGTTRRTLEDRAADWLSVKDFGAAGNGTSAASETTAFSNAGTTAATRSTFGAVFVPQGNYSLPTSPTQTSNVAFIGFGAKQTGSGYTAGTVDGLIAQRSTLFITEKMADPNGQFVLSIQAKGDATASASSYQKNALMVKVQHDDNSTYTSDGTEFAAATGVIGRDLVGISSHVLLGAGVTRGRIWGFESLITIPSGTDCGMQGLEIRVSNNGSAQPYHATSTTKYCVGLFADGSSYMTTGLTLARVGSGSFYDAICLFSDSMQNSAFSIKSISGAGQIDLMKITPTGQIFSGGTTATGAMFYAEKATGSSRSILAISNSNTTGAAYMSFTRLSAVAWSVGFDAADNRFRIAKSETFTAANTMLDMSTTAIQLFGAVSAGGGANVLGITNASVVPSSNPTGGGILYSEGGALKWRGSSGTVTTIAAA